VEVSRKGVYMSEKAPSRLSGDEAIKKAFGEVFRQIRERS